MLEEDLTEATQRLQAARQLEAMAALEVQAAAETAAEAHEAARIARVEATQSSLDVRRAQAKVSSLLNIWAERHQ